jgi:hypothetical protein
MHGLRPLLTGVLVGSALVAAIACGGSHERAVVDRFFRAARLHDLTILQTFSTTDFVPTIDGIVTRFEIDTISAERTIQLPPGEYPRSEVVRLSIDPPYSDTGTLTEKEIALRAEVRRGEAAAQWHDMTVTLQRATRPDGMPGRWVVTGVGPRVR